jgi:anaerobic dimethyl sulfoxide reductase subunit B (iron-sulfur subunit)
VYEWEKGAFPNLRIHYLAIQCYHCENPLCVKACPGKAIFKEDRYGAVLINEEACNPTILNCNRACWEACPYGSIVFASDDPNEKAYKCTMCIDRLERGLTPICVLSCPMRALDFKPLIEIKEKYGKKFTLTQQLEDMPSPEEVKPAVFMKPHNPKRVIVPWDLKKALEVLRERVPNIPLSLPPIFQSEEDVTNLKATKVGRDRLVLKAKSSEELIYYTSDNN